MQSKEHISSAATLAGLLGIAALCGYLLGRILTHVALPQVTVKEIPDTGTAMPAVILTGVEDGKLKGTMKGDARFFLGSKQVFPSGSGAIDIAVGSFFQNEITITVPAGMQFVASKKGSYYYPVLSASAENLAPANRIYFKDEAAAKAAGFKHPK